MKTLLKTLIGYVITASILSLLVMWVQMDLYPLTDDPDDQSIYSIVIGMLLASALYIWNDIEGRKLARNPPAVIEDQDFTEVQDTEETVDMKGLSWFERRLARAIDKGLRDPVLSGRMKAFEQSTKDLEDATVKYIRVVAEQHFKTLKDIPDNLEGQYRKIAVDVIKQKGGVKCPSCKSKAWNPDGSCQGCGADPQF